MMYDCKYMDSEDLVVGQFYQVVSHDNTACDETCPGYVSFGVLQFREREETSFLGPILHFAQPDDDDPEEWFVYGFYMHDCDMEIKPVVQ